jgi:hypothetical protein
MSTNAIWVNGDFTGSETLAMLVFGVRLKVAPRLDKSKNSFRLSGIE